MKTLLICHDEEVLTRDGLARWLNSFSDLVGIVILRETRKRKNRRIKREVKRVGIFRFLDVIAFRVYYRLFLSKKDKIWEENKLNELFALYSDIDPSVPVLKTRSPNLRVAREFIENLHPDIVIARCKVLLKKNIFTIPVKGTFVMHPGICPEYRNAHGCFWALANNDLEKVGMTLLKIDEGVDTGPIFGHYTYEYDELKESHVVIQHKVVVENFKELEEKLVEIYNDAAVPLEVKGRVSGTWGQPWLTRQLKWKSNARRRVK